MTTHVFIVDDSTFKYHLEYMFAGTGYKNVKVDFNGKESSKLNPNAEKTLVAMMADGSRIRKGDYIIFYLQAKDKHEGKFYGIFKAKHDGYFLDDSNLGQRKHLPFRLKIEPYKVFENGITEWEALDEIKHIQSPCQMLWSLIYRKLKGNRGNTMITIYEAERLFNLIRGKQEKILTGNNFSFDSKSRKIVSTNSYDNYKISQMMPNVLPRLFFKYNKNNAFETHLQMYIAQNIGTGKNISLDSIYNVSQDNIEWLGNEVSCGVGMRRMDIVFSKIIDETERMVVPIELKDEYFKNEIIEQIERYIDWLEQYYIPNRPSQIQPSIICKKPRRRNEAKFEEFINSIKNLNSRKNIKPLIYVEFEIENNDLKFEAVNYK